VGIIPCFIFLFQLDSTGFLSPDVLSIHEVTASLIDLNQAKASSSVPGRLDGSGDLKCISLYVPGKIWQTPFLNRLQKRQYPSVCGRTRQSAPADINPNFIHSDNSHRMNLCYCNAATRDGLPRPARNLLPFVNGSDCRCE